MKRLTDAEFAKVLFALTSQSSTKEIPAVVATFVQFVQKQQAQKRLPRILQAYEKYVEKKSGVVELEVTSAQKLSPASLNQIKELFGGKVVMTTNEDTALIGGVIVKTENRIFDGSIRTQLKKLKQHLS